MENYADAEKELNRIESTFRLSNAHTAPAELQRLVNEELRARHKPGFSPGADCCADLRTWSLAQSLGTPRCRSSRATKQHASSTPRRSRTKLCLPSPGQRGCAPVKSLRSRAATSTSREKQSESTSRPTIRRGKSGNRKPETPSPYSQCHQHWRRGYSNIWSVVGSRTSKGYCFRTVRAPCRESGSQSFSTR